MTHALRETLNSLRASPIFGFYLLVTLGVAGIIGLITVDVIDLGMTHFGQASHRTHDVTYGLIFTTGVVGVLAQLRRPDENVAGMLMALVPGAGLLLAGVLSNDFDAVVEFGPYRYAAAVTAVMALVHPAGRRFFSSVSVSRFNSVMLALVGVAALPLLALASTNLRLQRTVTDEHGFMGHYGFMAALSFTVIGVGLLASSRPDGWRVTTWVAGLLPAILGITSLLYPDATSSIDQVWALAAIAWGVTFIAAALVPDALGRGPIGSRNVAASPATAEISRPLVRG